MTGQPLPQFQLIDIKRFRLRDRARDTVSVDSEVVERAAELPADGGPSDTPETLLLRETMAPEVQAAVDALPVAFREAVWLRDVEEFSYAEIAEMLSIPVGTVVSDRDTGEQLGDLTAEGQTLLVAKGGKGGWGNTRFKSSTNRTPRKSGLGLPGEKRELALELKLIADVGLLGLLGHVR